jgi:hypothetical protein
MSGQVRDPIVALGLRHSRTLVDAELKGFENARRAMKKAVNGDATHFVAMKTILGARFPRQRQRRKWIVKLKPPPGASTRERAVV